MLTNRMRQVLASVIFLTGATAATANSSFDFARVTQVEPIYRTVQVAEPQTECWDEQVAYHQQGHQDSATPAIVGGLLGAALGNAVGHKKRNKQVGAVAGAVLGASIGSDIGRRHQPGATQYRTEQRCETVTNYSTRQEISGYRVHYRYHGKHFTTRTNHHPGDRIRVRVQVTPA